MGKINYMGESNYVKAVQKLRQSGAYGKHQDKRERRARTRAANKDRDFREQEKED